MEVLVNMRFNESGMNDLTGNIWTNNGATFDKPGKFGGKAICLGKQKSAEILKDMRLGTDSFTVSFWFKTEQITGSYITPINQFWQSMSYGAWDITIIPGISVGLNISTVPGYNIGDETKVTDGVWHHVAFVRKDNKLYLFLDGKLNVVKEITPSDIVGSSTLPLRLGLSGYNKSFYEGELDDVVIIKDKAYWTEDFTPPTDYLLGGGNEGEEPEEPEKPVECSLPSGMILHFGTTTAPKGWLECDGSEVSKTTYANLFTAIGENFGKATDINKFKLPDLRGEFIRGYDSGRGLDKNREFGSEQVDALQNHYHGGVVSSINANGDLTDSFSNQVDSPSVKSSGQQLPVARVADETRPHNVSLLACIKI